MSTQKKTYTTAEKKKYAAKQAKARDDYRRPRVAKQVRRMVKNKPFKLSGCAEEYLNSLLFPFEAPGACIPSFFPLSSQKLKFITRGQLQLGTTGFGYVMARSVLFNLNTQACVITSSAASTGGAATAIAAFGGNTAYANTASPYLEGQFITTNDVQARTVSMGLRIRYLGREDARSGVISLIEQPDHLELINDTFLAIVNQDGVLKVRPAEDWIQLNYSGPTIPSDVEYTNTGKPLGGNYFMGMFIQGAASDLYEFEFVQNCEVIGRIVQGKTESHSDIPAYGLITAAAKSASKNSPLQPSNASTVLTDIVHGISSNAPQIMSAVSSGIQGLLGVIDLNPTTILSQALGSMMSTSRGLFGGGGSGLLGLGSSAVETWG